MEETSKHLQEMAVGMNESLRSLLEYTGSEEREKSQRSTFEACLGVSECIRVLEKSLYAQKYAYYFRRVREWCDYNEVR